MKVWDWCAWQGDKCPLERKASRWGMAQSAVVCGVGVVGFRTAPLGTGASTHAHDGMPRRRLAAEVFTCMTHETTARTLGLPLAEG